VAEKASPRLFDHCQTVFAAMRENSSSVRILDGGSDRHALVYEGFLTKLFKELDLPTPYYTHVMRRLQAMGCVLQLSRGGGGSPSRWELIVDPELPAFSEAEGEEKKQPSRLEMLEKNFNQLSGRQHDSEELLQEILDLLRDKPEQEAV
jgi:hypothetical protein